MPEALLRARELTKTFGGLAAVNKVSLELWQDRIHVVIGPNGAGKSTLTNLLSGDLPPSSGRIELAGQDITRAAPEQISRQGLGRSYQKTNIFPSFSVWENIRLAAQSRAAQQGFEITPSTAQALRERISADIAAYGPLVSEGRIARM